MKKIFFTLTIGIAIGIIIMQLIFLARINKIDSQEVLFKVTVTNNYINVRSQPTTNADKVYEAIKGETYKVIEIFDEDPNYTWYKIVFSDRKTGWIASSVLTPWVKEVKK